MNKFSRFGGKKPSTLHRQALNALRRGDLFRAAGLFDGDADTENAARCREHIQVIFGVTVPPPI